MALKSQIPEEKPTAQDILDIYQYSLRNIVMKKISVETNLVIET